MLYTGINVVSRGDIMADKGKPRAFKTAEEFENKFMQYIKYCRDNKRFSNIAGFCAYCRVTRDTFYAQKEYYSDTYNIIQNILEDEVLQDNTYRAQLYLKNKFGYTDKQELDLGNKDNKPFEVRNMSDAEIEKMLEECGYIKNSTKE